MASAQGDSPPVKFELSPRNELYVKISENLSVDQVKSLRAMLITDHHIGKGKIETATAHEIFNMLEDDHKIGEGNLGFLIELLKALGKTQMAQELEKVERIELPTTSKRKASEDSSSTKHPRMRRNGGGSDDSDNSAESGISSSSRPESMKTDESESGGTLAASAEGTTDGPTLGTVGDVRKRIEHLRKKYAKLTRYPNNISEAKAEELSKVCKETDDLVNIWKKQSKGKLKVDIALLDTEIQKEFQDICESGALHQKIGKEVEQSMRSTSDDVVRMKTNVNIEVSSNTSENTNFSPGRCATIKVTAEHVELADSCKLDKGSVVKHLFRHLVGNPQKLRPIVTYLNSFSVQVRSISLGSIDFACLCLTPESAASLQKEYDDKRLEAEIQRVISSLATLEEFGIKSISLAVQLEFMNKDLSNITDTGSTGTDCTMEDQDDIVLESSGLTSSSSSRCLVGPVDNEEATENLGSKLVQMEVGSEHKWQRDKPTYLTPAEGLRVEELKPKKGGQPVHGSSIPLILPNDLKYNASTGIVEKIQDAQRATLHAVPQALELLEGIEEPVSVLAICGPCRTGKSYILSRLLGTADAFALGHSMAPQTFGIWMGTKVLRGKDFTIVLLDTEGIDAVGASAGQDAGILVLTILLSSYLIYNSLNVPYKADLEKMQCFLNLAEGITMKQEKETDVAAFREFFPDFLWLLRDVTLKMEDKNGKEMDPTEYLVTKVLSRSRGFRESTGDMVGRVILTFFPSVECAKLERPSGDTEVMNNIAQHTDKLNPEFNKGVEELMKRLLEKARAKRGCDKASTVSGAHLSIMTEQYVAAVNDPNSIPALDNTWKNTVELMRVKAIEEAVMEYNKQMQAGVAEARKTENGEVPLEEEETSEGNEDTDDERNIPSQPTLMDLHHASFKEATAMFLKKVGHFGISSEKQGPDESNSVVDQMQKRLVQREERTVDYVANDGKTYQQKGYVVTDGELFKYIQQNKEHSRVFCQETFKRLFEPIREHVETNPPDYDFKQLLEELDHAGQKYIEQARGPEKWVVLKEMAKSLEKLEADFKKIKGYEEKAFQEQQKAKEAEIKAMEKEKEFQQLNKQKQDMEKAQQETMQKMQQQLKDQMEKFKHDEEQRNAQELKKIQDLKDALMADQAKIAMERNELQNAKAMDMMKSMHQEQAGLTRQLIELMARQNAAPPASSGCTIS